MQGMAISLINEDAEGDEHAGLSNGYGYLLSLLQTSDKRVNLATLLKRKQVRIKCSLQAHPQKCSWMSHAFILALHACAPIKRCGCRHAWPCSKMMCTGLPAIIDTQETSHEVSAASACLHDWHVEGDVAGIQHC